MYNLFMMSNFDNAIEENKVWICFNMYLATKGILYAAVKSSCYLNSFR